MTRRGDPSRVCVVCGAVFRQITAGQRARFCSYACRRADGARRQREAYARRRAAA